VLFTKGSGTHEIDFDTYKIKPGSVFTIAPGQIHNWKTSKDICGYVFFHTKDFYNKGYTTANINDYPFFNSIHNPPLVVLGKDATKKMSSQFVELINEHEQSNKLKFEKIHCLINLIYIELSRNYLPSVKINNEKYQLKIRLLENLIDQYFKLKKYPYEYAAMMNLSEKHLNRMSKECLNKTTSALIAERIVLEAKRMLIHTKYTVSEIATDLGYEDNSYFSRFFKKHCNITPLVFFNKYR